MGNKFYQTKQVQSISLNWMRFGGNLNTIFFFGVFGFSLEVSNCSYRKLSRDKLLPTNNLKHF